ncbi:MAG: PCRF domain-containing protein, partial [Clostridia bacterium]|nr:PCRF domain-containing protein [Clostridia bacterium]
MIVQLENAKTELLALRDEVKELGSALRIEELNTKIAEKEKLTEAEGFWNDTENNAKVLKELKDLKNKKGRYDALYSAVEDAIVLCEMGIEEDDESVVEEVQSELAALSDKKEKMRLEVLLNGEFDHCNALLSLHPGAGGTE